MDQISLFKKALAARASEAPEFDYDDASNKQITALVNKYCEALDTDNDDQKDIYCSALILKFWNRGSQLYKSVKATGEADLADCYHRLYSRINYACKYRVWQRPDKKVTAQQAINQAISTETLNILYQCSLHKKAANVGVNKISIDQSFDSGSDDNELTIADTLYDVGETTKSYKIENELLIQSCFNHNKPIEAIIMHLVNNGYGLRKSSVSSMSRKAKNVTKSRKSDSLVSPSVLYSVIHNTSEDQLVSLINQSYVIDNKTLLTNAVNQLKSSSQAVLKQYIVSAAHIAEVAEA